MKGLNAGNLIKIARLLSVGSLHRVYATAQSIRMPLKTGRTAWIMWNSELPLKRCNAGWLEAHLVRYISVPACRFILLIVIRLFLTQMLYRNTQTLSRTHGFHMVALQSSTYCVDEILREVGIKCQWGYSRTGWIACLDTWWTSVTGMD